MARRHNTRSKQFELSGNHYLVITEGSRQDYRATVYRWSPDGFGSGRWEEALRSVHYLWYLLREVYVIALAKATGLDEDDVLRQVADRRTKEALCLI